MVIFQIVFDLIILIALIYLYQLINTSKLGTHIVTGKSKGYEIPHCYKCDTIQKVIKVGDQFVCQICANH